MHLNLAALESGAAKQLEVPTDIKLNYNGHEQTVDSASPAWYNSTLYQDIDITYTAQDQVNNSANDTSKAGEYEVTLTIKQGKPLAWLDATSPDDKTRKIKMTINKADINVQYDATFKDKMDFAWHVDLTTDLTKLRFPDSEYQWDTRKIIELSSYATDDDKKSVRIYYYITTHPDDKHNDSDIEDATPQENFGDWLEFDPQNPDDRFKIKKTEGYCVYFKITADNHNTKIDHFSVHVVQEVLQITMSDYNLGTQIYGFAFETQSDLYKILNGKVTTIQDQYNVSRKDELMLPANEAKFDFYFTTTVTGSGTVYNTKDKGGSVWDVGKYYLQVRYNDGDASYISFEWGDKSDAQHPYLEIEQKKVALTWVGNTSWESDRDNNAAEPTDITDQYAYVYDGDSKKLTATYNAKLKETDPDDIKTLDAANITLATGDGINVGSYNAKAADLKNFAFTNNEHAFKIVKAKNSWTTPYSCKGWSVGGDTSNVETKAVPKFGLASAVEYVYHKETKEGEVIQYSELFNQPAMKVVVVYSLAADSAGNYGEIEGEYTFTISSCAHDKIKDEQYHEGDSEHSTQHYRICPDCTEKVYNDCQAKPLLEYTATQHYSVCKFCERKYDYKDHNWKDPEVTPPTCTENGKKVTKCQDCEYQKEEAGDAATGHNYTDSWTWSADNIPTLTITCSNSCGASEVFTAGAGGVTVQSATNKPATCDENGETKYTAKYTFEGHEYTDEHTAVINAKGHANKHKVEAKAATCAEEGNNEYWHCDDCNKNYRDETCVFEIGEDNIKLAKTAHSYATEWASDGTSHYHECSVCHDKKDVAAHTEVKTAAVAATCTEDGLTEGSSCSICNKVLVAPETVPATGHEHMDHHEYKEAQATSAGNLEYWYCDDCESYFLDDSGTLPTDKNSVIIPALGSTLNGGNLNPPLGGDTGLSGSGSGSGSDVGEFFKQNWWWIVLIAAIIILLIATIAIVSAVHRRRREREMDKRFEMMMRMQAGAYQPMGAYQYGQNGAAAGGVEGVEGGGRLALPSGISEETLAKAIAIALNEVNSAKTETADEGTRLDDVDGFYDDVEDPDNPTGSGQ